MTPTAYRVPSMAEIADIKGTNGFRVVSTFSGCGGSCLGFEMSGYEIVWANEFIDEAAKTYELNHPGVTVDRRDIRQVTAADILAAAGVAAGDIDVLEGSPPCASFSTAGKRHKGWGQVNDYSDDKQQRSDDLFFEYARLLDGLQPRTFVAENVSGLVKGSGKGYFIEILAALKRCGYRVEARLLNAQWLGVPQARQRLIFVGVRNDLTDAAGKPVQPVFPKPLPYTISLRDALSDLVDVAGSVDYPGKIRSPHAPAHTITAVGGRTYPNGIAPCYVVTNDRSEAVADDDERAMDLSFYAVGKEWRRLRQGESSDKYFNLIRPLFDRPCPTVTATAGIQGAAGVTHPLYCRKFSIPELRRICSFPDDFALTGKFSQRWERLGRSVPPLMMRAVAEVVRDEILGVAV